MNSPYGLPIIDNCRTSAVREFLLRSSSGISAAFDCLKQTAMYPEGAVIFVEGQLARGIFLICQGQAKLSTTSRDGKILIMRMAGAGEVLGLDATVSVIAVAHARKLTVITGENATGKVDVPRIPDVCNDLGIRLPGVGLTKF